MNNDLKVSLQEVSDTASQIRTLNQKLDDVLNYVSKLMNELNNVWQSDGQDAILGRFQKFANKFIDESETIESYAKFLDNTVSAYDSIETTITSNANTFE